jgi:hypoxanthine phosphoribosyltransferase
MAAKKKATKQVKRPLSASVRKVSDGAEPDEFSAAGGLPLITVPGADRSGDKRAVRELSWSEFDAQVRALAAQLAKGFKPEAVVGLVHGGVFVGGALASVLKAEFFPVRITHRSRDHHSDVATDDLPAALAGRRVLLVDDIASSGDSLEFALKLARARGVRKVVTAALLARPGKYEPDFAAFVSDEFFIFPWDYAPLVNDARFGAASRQQVEPLAPARKPSKGKKARPRKQP